MPDTVYFATNRSNSGAATDPIAYGTGMLPRGRLTMGRAMVADPDFTQDSSGAITELDISDWTDPQSGCFGDLWQGGRPVIAFIHGFANSFADAITRAAYIRAFYRAGGLDANIVAFSWPSEGRVIELPLVLQPYLDDQAAASASAGHVVMWLRLLAAQTPALRGAGQSVHLLAHSMGNRVLAEAVQNLASQGQLPPVMFDTAISAAGDEPSDTFATAGLRLNRLSALASRIGVLFSEKDLVLSFLSDPINYGFGALFRTRLGESGPDNMRDPLHFPPAVYDFLDATDITDWQRGDPIEDFEASHQYYRRSAQVRGSVVAFMGGGWLVPRLG